MVVRSAGLGGSLSALILTLSALVPVTGVAIWQGIGARPPLADVTRMMIAGVMMGIGLVAFVAVTNSRQIEASVSIPIMDTSMLIVTVVGAVLYFSEPVTLRKCLGLALLIVGILVLRPE